MTFYEIIGTIRNNNKNYLSTNILDLALIISNNQIITKRLNIQSY